MNALFDSAGLAIVAYAEIIGTDGTSPSVNSGVDTSRVSAGQYQVALRPGNTQTPVGNDTYPRDLVFAQVIQHPLDDSAFIVKVDPINTISPTTGKGTFNVVITNGSTFVDASFAVLVLRTITPAPTNLNGVAGGPT